MLRSYIGDRKSGFLFETESGKMLSPENLWRDGFATIDREMGREGVSFHAFRRFREAVLQATECRDLPIDYWMGHSNPQMGSRYARQLMEDKEVPSKMGEKRRTRLRDSHGCHFGAGLDCARCATKSRERSCSLASHLGIVEELTTVRP